MIYLDTHVVIWLYAGLSEKFSEQARALINDHEISISPIVRLELQYLHEIQRVTDDSQTVVDDLINRIGLSICDKPFDQIITKALIFPWTRDPFDRFIVAHAALNDNILLSKDQSVRKNYTHAKW